MVRIALAEIAQETDSFSRLRADRSEFESFGLYHGQEIVERMQGAGPLGGFFEVAAEHAARHGKPIEFVPLIRAWGGAGGPILHSVFAQFRKELCDRLKQAGPVDAVFLLIHGAASTESEDDAEGVLLEEVRQIVGEKVPIVSPFDHHANITEKKVANADLLVGHETQPHDPPRTGRKAARLLFDILSGKIKPVRAWQKIPMITPQDQFLTSGGPMKAWFDKAREFERMPGVLDVSPCPMQPWLDVYEGGWAVIAQTDNQPELAKKIAAEMAELAWSLRKEYWRSERVAPAEAVAKGVAAREGLVLLSDTGDSVYGGAPGDNTTLLAELVKQQAPCLSLVPVVDADAVAAAHQAGVGATITLPIGGKGDHVFCKPVTITGRVAAVCEGLSAEIAERGVCQIGRTALVECGAIRIALLDNRSFVVNHPLLYAHLGVDVSAAKLVVLKTASNFQFFAAWRKELIRVDTPGTTQSNLADFDWKHLPRPIDPFDEIEDWRPNPQVFAGRTFGA